MPHLPQSSQPHAVIVGGGLAGLAAATALAERGVRITLLESRPRLGGRASSFEDAATQTQIDNCQHVNMGCCTNFQKFCSVLGLSNLLRTEPALYFVGPDARVHRLDAGILPAPLHLLSSFRRLSYLTPGDLWGIGRGLRRLVRENGDLGSESMAAWLARQGQTPAAIERFWQVVLVSALSESLERIDVRHARKVFEDAFLSHRRGWEVQIPTVPLDALYGKHIVRWLADRGGTVRLKSGVKRVVMRGELAGAVELRSGEVVEADEFVIAVPHYLVLPLLPEQLRETLSGVSRLESAPISSVHLWFERPMTDLPHAVLVGRLSQWMFNRTRLQSEFNDAGLARGGPDGARTESGDSAAGRYYYQVVISASRNLDGRPQQEIIDAVVDELSDIWPAARRAGLTHARLVTEHKAVFSVTPGVDALRPVQQTRVANLQLAGDWTKTGWPATMEGAVRSGYLAAENVLARLGRPERILAADLPKSLFSRLLLGL